MTTSESELDQTLVLALRAGLVTEDDVTFYTEDGKRFADVEELTPAMYAVGWLTNNQSQMGPNRGLSEGVGTVWYRVPRFHGNSGPINQKRCISVLRYGLDVAPLVGAHNGYEFFCREIPISYIRENIAGNDIDHELIGSLFRDDPRPIPYGAMGYVNTGEEHTDELLWNI